MRLRHFDLTIVLLPTNWDPDALSVSLNSIARLMQADRLSVECLCAEMLPEGTVVEELYRQTIPAMPKTLHDYLHFENFNFLVEYGSSTRALRRIVRSARGEFVCVLREGDQIGFRLSHDRAFGKDDVTIGVSIANADALTSHSQLSNTDPNIQTLSSLAALLAAYDGSFFVRREFLDRELGRPTPDAAHGYPYFLNSLLPVSLIFSNGRVGFSDQIAVCPAELNTVAHEEALLGHTMEYLRDRLYQHRSDLEKGSLIVIDFVFDYLMRVTQGIVSGRQLESIPMVWSFPREHLFAGLAREKNDSFRDFVTWSTQHAALLTKREKSNTKSVISALSIRPYRALPRPETPVVSIVSSAYRARHLIYGFLKNLVEQTLFPQCELLIVSPEINSAQSVVTEFFALFFPNIIIINLEKDPGLYECWNIAIRRSKGRYLSNANVDDRRHREHLDRVVAAIEETDADVGSTAVAVTRDLNDVLEFSSDLLISRAGNQLEVWHSDDAEQEYKLNSLNDFFLMDGDGSILQCLNFPHSMPVWDRKLHEKVGYFDELENGTYADFALWLEAASRGKKFVHLVKAFGLYLINEESHNRSNSDDAIWRRLIHSYMPHARIVKLPEHCSVRPPEVARSSNADHSQRPWKFDFGNSFNQNFGRHRSGWAYALSALRDYHDPAAEVSCETFIEKRFVWGADGGDASSPEPQPYSNPWIGFIHVPPRIPGWFQFEQSNTQVFRSGMWKKSLPNCRGLLCLTKYHRQYLLDVLKPKFPISVVYHPTEIPESQFDFNRYCENPIKRLVQVGWWLRKLNAISRVEVPGHIPTILGTNDWVKSILSYAERRYYCLLTPQQADAINFLENDAYDCLLSENLVFLDFYDTSANNTIIECIARSTPIVVCRHPAVEEYLGNDYPLFYETYAEIPRLVSDRRRLLSAHEKLKSQEIRARISAENFVNLFRDSEVLHHAYEF